MIEVPHQRVLFHPAGACGSYRRARFAARINSMPKFAVYRTLDSPLRWNASLIGGASCASVATACRPTRFGVASMTGLGRSRPSRVDAGASNGSRSMSRTERNSQDLWIGVSRELLITTF